MANSASTPPDPGIIEAEMGRIGALMKQRQFAAALAACEAMTVLVPENRDMLYMMARCLRFLDQPADALAVLDRLEHHHPGFSGLYQERGHCYVAAKDAPQATQAYLAAVNINPALPASWAQLQVLFRMTGDAANAAVASEHVVTLKNLPPEVVTATALFTNGDLDLAEPMIRNFLLRQGNHIEAMRLLARIGIAREVYDDAEVLLDAVLQLVPDYRLARFEYAQVLLSRHKYLRASEELRKLLADDPQNRQYETLYATACVGIGEHEIALGLYRRSLVDAPQTAELHLSVAHSLKTLGRTAEAIDSYRAAAAVRPGYGDAYWSLANLKTYRFGDEEIERMRVQEAVAVDLKDRYHLCFALGKALEDRGQYEESYAFYGRGNELKKSEGRYSPDPVERIALMQVEVCNREFFAARGGVGAPDRDPIFILGLPRAGSTLIEQILASHSRVEGTQELAEIPRLVHELQGRSSDDSNSRYPRVLTELPPQEFRRLGEKYLEDTRIYRSGKQLFVDKMPNNFRHIGLLHLMLPNAKIIDARREPMACCFSNLKQLFASGQEFTYSIEDIARYYRTYLDLMQHWDEMLPGKILRVWHEDLVDDLEANVRRILGFCGLDFEPACVEFHRNERSVRTASSEQVRRPIFREGLDQWKRYEPWLGALKEALGDARERYHPRR